MTFKDRVLQIVEKTNVGDILTYKEVATLAGKPKGSRAVAKIMSNNYDPSIPCHRIIKSDGTIGGYNRGGEVVKRDILRKEMNQRT